MKSTRLTFKNFKGPFITHGIDIIPDPAKPKTAVYIFAVNHPPSPEFLKCASPSQCKVGTKARSQIELFHHTLGSTTIQHVRTIRDKYITTPNDIYAQSPTSFFVTNDHFYREGILRETEDLLPLAQWSNTIHVDISDLRATNPEAGINASIALTGIHNNNGLGHGQSDDEILVTSAMGGRLYRGRMADSGNGKTKDAIRIVDSIEFGSAVDNPSYFDDPYRTETVDKSGYVLGGLSHVIRLGKTKQDPKGTDGVMVWFLERSPLPADRREKVPLPEPRVLFQDDGQRIRSASVALLVPIKPKKGEQKREAWLFISGFVSLNMIAVKVEL